MRNLRTGRKSARLLQGMALWLAAVPVQGFCASEEIQVYTDDLSAPGTFGADIHGNYVPSSRGALTYPGAQAPRHVLRITPELYYGLTRELELGLYLLASRDAYGNVHQDGAKVRLKYIAPHDPDRGFFWGANLEVGNTAPRVSELRWNNQLKGIVGYRTGLWMLALNPNLDWSPQRAGGPTTLSVDGKIGYSVSAKTMVGAELYNDFGRLSRPQSFGRNAKVLYAAVDHEFEHFDLNAGLGRGLASDADRWVVKCIVGLKF